MPNNGVGLYELVEIKEGIYWLGTKDTVSGFYHNHYLLMEEDQAVVISAGNSVNILDVIGKFSTFIPLNRITHAVFNGLVGQIGCAVVNMWETIRAAGGNLKVVSHPRASLKISFYYGLKYESFYHVDQKGWKLTFNSGRTLRFIDANNLSYPGSFMTYDEKTGTLFSGELFSGYPFGWSLYANSYYLASMEAYHCDFIPFGQLINRALDGLDKFDVRLIAPSHGSIINSEIEKYVEAARNVKKAPAISRNTEQPFNNVINVGGGVTAEGSIQ
jgi:flavorubredoxin